MKIKIIGSGDMWGKFNSASYLIDNNILIDVPNGTCKNLIRYNILPKDIDNILITHFHGDHYFDIPFYILQKSRYESNNVNIYCDRKGKNKIKKLFKLGFSNASKKVSKTLNIKYNFDMNFKINDYEIEKVLVDHGNIKPCFGYVIKDDKTIGFTGDTCYCDNVEYMASICDYLFCDCTLITGNNKHMGIDNIKSLAKKYQNCIFIVSHLSDNTRNEIKMSKNIILAIDGNEINI